MSPPDLRQTQIFMTLAGLAYGKPSELPRYLAADKLTAGDLEPAFIPTEPTPPDNFAFLVRAKATGGYILAIRGTYPNPLSSAYWDDGDEDTPFGTLQPWPGAEARGAKVSAGTWRGFNNVLALSDGAATLAQTLLALPQGASLAVAGHSLGGTLAPVVALWLSERRADVDLLVAPFAGMTPGNLAFKSLFGIGAPLQDRVFRTNNSLDTVGYGWDRTLSTWSFYQPHPRGGVLVQALLLFTAIRLWFYGFAAIGFEKKLPGQVNPPATKSELIAYVIENLEQHLPATYLKLLGAPPLPFDVGFGSVVTEDLTLTPATLAKRGRGRKVYYAEAAVMHRMGP